MFSCNSINNCPPTGNYTNPCSSILSSSNDNGNSNYCRPANCYRPLQQLYKTVYSPMYGNNSSSVNFACICRPAERYKTTNMTYGSFYYDNSISTQKTRAIDYDRAVFAQCYSNNKSGYQSTDKNRSKDSSIIANRSDPQENQYWTQPTSDVCCPTNCCNNTSYNTANCQTFSSNHDPCSSPSTPNKSSNVQVRCV